jgi:ribosome-associated protein
VTIDLAGKTTLADWMVVATGTSQRRIAGIADKLIERLKARGLKGIAAEGLRDSNWVLIDAGDVIVHIFRPEVRQFYNLEKMWSGDRPNEPVAV